MEHGGARPGAGRKPGRKVDTSLNIRIPTEELEAAKHAAEKQGYTKFSEWVREALRRML
jgi:predicted DNA binding CopG/RHH family protein